MTEQEILEDDKLIAEFMEYYFHAGKFYKKGAKTLGQWFSIPKYNISWDWLMPVWCRIRDLRFKEMKHEFEHADIKQNCAHAICYRDIQSAYYEIVNAIKWYNTTK